MAAFRKSAMRDAWKVAGSATTAVACGLLISARERVANALQPRRGRGIVQIQTLMKGRLAACLVLVAALAAPAWADARRDEAREHVEFGIEVAQRGLWREAIYRWEKAVEIDPTYAAAFNDLAIGYEHEGEFEKARESYEKALQLEPDNIQIQQNFELFKEINDRRGTANEKP